MMRMLKSLLDQPWLYQAFQEAGGFFGARVKAIDEFLQVRPGMRIIDIGCGPGFIVNHLPKDIDYIGFDIDEGYINYAIERFPGRARFFCRFFDAAAADEFGPADIVMMNGVLHHIPDAELKCTLEDIYRALAPNGVLFSLDGCYRDGQTAFRRWMLDNDRGRHVRDESGYRQLLDRTFDNVDMHVRENYSRVPYTFVVGLSEKRLGI